MFVIMETRVCTREYIKKGGWDMRHNLKAAAVSALAIMAALAMSIPAYAADKKISEVKRNRKRATASGIRMYKLRRVMLRLPSRSLTMTTASGREVISRSST